MSEFSSGNPVDEIKRCNLNGIHDMGGMHGFGKIEIEADEPVFHAKWEGRVYAMAMYTPVDYSNGFRFTIENIDPALYLSYSYYEKWLHARIEGLIETGVFSREEFDNKAAHFKAFPDEAPPVAHDPEKVSQVVSRIYAPYEQDVGTGATALFEVGQTVVVKNSHPVGHTRLPGYCKGKRGIVDKNYGDWLVDDTPPPGLAQAIEKLYRVRFDGHELWGNDAEDNQVLYIDMFESYLESV